QQNVTRPRVQVGFPHFRALVLVKDRDAPGPEPPQDRIALVLAQLRQRGSLARSAPERKRTVRGGAHRITSAFLPVATVPSNRHRRACPGPAPRPPPASVPASPVRPRPPPRGSPPARCCTSNRQSPRPAGSAPRLAAAVSSAAAPGASGPRAA